MFHQSLEPLFLPFTRGEPWEWAETTMAVNIASSHASCLATSIALRPRKRSAHCSRLVSLSDAKEEQCAR